MVFLTDGENDDKPETEIASRELENVLDCIESKFNVLGVGEKFDVKILENLVRCGSYPGVISCDMNEAFPKILNTFET